MNYAKENISSEDREYLQCHACVSVYYPLVGENGMREENKGQFLVRKISYTLLSKEKCGEASETQFQDVPACKSLSSMQMTSPLWSKSFPFSPLPI